MALSPDGRTLAVSTGGGYGRDLFEGGYGPDLFDARTGRRVGPDPHRGDIQNLFFLSDGKILRTIDSENYSCLWDAATLRLRGRMDLGRGLDVLSARPTDGKYLLCRDFRPGGDKPVLTVVDADIGGVVCTFPNVETEDSQVLWLSDSQLLVPGVRRFALSSRLFVRQNRREKRPIAEERLHRLGASLAPHRPASCLP